MKRSRHERAIREKLEVAEDRLGEAERALEAAEQHVESLQGEIATLRGLLEYADVIDGGAGNGNAES